MLVLSEVFAPANIQVPRSAQDDTFVSCTIFTMFTIWCTERYITSMKRATITLPDDIAKAVDDYIEAQEVPPALTTVMQVALRAYLSERGFLRARRSLRIRPNGKSGRSDVSQNHDLYFTGLKK